jgi:hypothetical protein
MRWSQTHLQNKLPPIAKVSVLSAYHGEAPNEERPGARLGELPVENENEQTVTYTGEVDEKVSLTKDIRGGR